MSINSRRYLVCWLLFTGWIICAFSGVSVQATIYMCALAVVVAMLPEPHGKTIDGITHAKGVLDDRSKLFEFEKWISDKPELQSALIYAHDLKPDDFMTFCRLLIEIRYRKDQDALAMLSRMFKAEKN